MEFSQDIDRVGMQQASYLGIMNRLESKPETSRRVLYFLCQLERCGDEDFISRLPMSRDASPQREEAKPDQTLLFSTN